MQSLRTSLLAIATLLAIVPVAFAQDTGATASGKRVSVVGGYALSEPTKDPDGTHVDGDGVGTLGVTYHINDRIGIEAWGTDKAGHRVSAGGPKLASVGAQPVALSGQYHFRDADKTVRPFVGLGYHETNYSEERADAAGALAGQRIGMETAKGAMATAGVDVALGSRWFARADARYLDGDSDLKVDGIKVDDAKLNPLVVGVGIGAKF